MTTQLPQRDSDDFPEALKARREQLGLSYTDLANAIGIHPVMPSRYENRNHSEFAKPKEGTWKKLNDFLYPDSDAEDFKPSDLEGLSIEDLVKALKQKGVNQVKLIF